MLGYAEIQYLDLTGRGQHDVFRLDVAMYDAVFVGGDERFCALRGNLEELLQGHGPPHALSQSLALDVLHDQEEFAKIFDDIVDARDMLRLESTSPLSFTQQDVLPGLRIIAQLVGDALEGHGALELGIFSVVDLAHAAGAQLGADHKPAHASAGQVLGGRKGYQRSAGTAHGLNTPMSFSRETVI